MTPSPALPASCPLCGGQGGALLDTRSPGFEWTLCACGLVFRTREPDGGRPVGGDGAAPSDDDYFRRYARRRRRRVAKARRQVLDALEFAPRGRLVDVGCSLGYTMEAARSLGLDAAGVDVSAHAVASCRRAGFDAREGDLHHLPFDDAMFSVAILKHVFEHTPAPREALRELRRVLAPGGAAFFAVPNGDWRRATRAAATSRFFRGDTAWDHFVYYTPATLSRLVADEGFRVAAVHPVLVHRRAGLLRALADVATAPLRVPLRAAAEALALRKEFWLVAVRLPDGAAPLAASREAAPGRVPA